MSRPANNAEWFDVANKEYVAEAVKQYLWEPSDRYMGFARCPYCGAHYRADVVKSKQLDYCPDCLSLLKRGDGDAVPI